MATLKAQHLAKAYKSRQVVRDVSLSIDSGQIVGLLGPNGAGKTTCFYMIVGLVQADQGRVLIDDLDVSHQPMHGRAKAGIGYLPQEASIFRKLSVADNIMAILETRQELDKAKVVDKDSNTTQGEKIVYDTVKKLASAGRATGSKVTESRPRIDMVIQPKKKTEEKTQ